MSTIQCGCKDKHEEWCANHPARLAAEPDGKPNAERYPSGLRCDCPPGKHAEYCANARKVVPANAPPGEPILNANPAPAPPAPPGEAPLTKADVAGAVKEALTELLGSAAKPA